MELKKHHYILSLLLPIQILIVNMLSSKTVWIETYYSTGFYPKMSKILQSIFGGLPFSLGDLLYLTLIIYVLAYIYRLIKFKRFQLKSFLIGVFSFASIIYFFFYLNWGMNYFRKPLDQIIQLEKTTYTDDELFLVTEQLLIKANEKHLLLVSNDTLLVTTENLSKKEIRKIAKHGYQNLNLGLPNLDLAKSPVKASLFSTLLSYMGFAGYLNPWSNESQINNRIPLNSYPSTACHEIAHQLGFASESEANFIGYLAGMANENKLVQYSSSIMALRYCMFEVYKRNPEKYELYLEQIHLGIKKDFQQRREFWETYQNWSEPFFKLFYDSYLKVNNQTHGIQSYNRMVGLLVNYRLEFDLN